MNAEFAAPPIENASIEGIYRAPCGGIYEINRCRGKGKHGRKIELHCTLRRCKGVSTAVLNTPYPIAEAHVRNMLRYGLWVRVEMQPSQAGYRSG